MEVIESNLILIVLDSSSNFIEDHYKTITSVLDELGATNQTQIVLNKIDLVKSESRFRFLKNQFPDGIYISALDKLRMESLKDSIIKTMDKDHVEIELHIPYSRPKDIALSQRGVKIIKREYQSDYIYLKIKGSMEKIDQIRDLANK
tara:strand:+ start:164 stop:604 length:441 start_codon:yes stop_codon:yes gene_type:complete